MATGSDVIVVGIPISIVFSLRAILQVARTGIVKGCRSDRASDHRSTSRSFYSLPDSLD
jgi:hypothetical protein